MSKSKKEYKELENKICNVIMTVQEVMGGHSPMAKSRILSVAVRRIMDIIEERKTKDEV